MSPEMLATIRKIAEKCSSKDEWIDHDYWAAEAAKALPEAVAHIDQQSAIMARLEAAYLEAETDFWQTSLGSTEAATKARGSLERIKRGEQA